MTTHYKGASQTRWRLTDKGEQEVQRAEEARSEAEQTLLRATQTLSLEQQLLRCEMLRQRLIQCLVTALRSYSAELETEARSASHSLTEMNDTEPIAQTKMS